MVAGKSDIRLKLTDGREASDLPLDPGAHLVFQGSLGARELGLDPEKVNPNGSGISLGHPVGATGAIIATKAIHELHRIQGRYALATMCIGGGQGIAVLFERT